MMNDLIFAEQSQRFKVYIPGYLLIEIQKQCILAYPNETGGILAGKYSRELDCAYISELLKAPPGSKSGRTWFLRGIKGIKKKLDRLWNKKTYYLGEWHYHPDNSSTLSNQDIKQMFSISNNPNYKCPEPILFIVGGKQNSWEYSVYVFPQCEKYIHLNLVELHS
ncbi:Mov34/MPN/PAD-1 family protein [Alkalicoccus urumqiensis]|nr:Mov34/MPN/PAD-1 family protein [Alkalicoccus urumqiensis]